MAYVKLTNGQTKMISRIKSHEIWSVLNGEKEGTKEQQAFCANIDKIYLNRHTAPQSYIEAHWDILKSMP